MQALFWISIGVVAALVGVASWMTLACVVVGRLLRFSHQTVVASHGFGLVRRYGLLGALWRSPTIAARRAIGPSNRSWDVLFMAVQVAVMAVLVAAVGFTAAFALPGIVPLIVRGSLISAKLGGLLEETAIFIGCFGALTATCVWMRGLVYVARPSISRKIGPPGTWFPPQLSRRARDHLSLNIYWYTRIDTAIIFSAFYSLWFPWVLLSSSPDNSSGTSSASPRAAPLFPV
jgi:hypothetical protein